MLPGQGGQAEALFVGLSHRSMSHPASSLLASAQALAAGEALVTAMALCQRCSASAPPAASERLWFRLLQSFVEVLLQPACPCSHILMQGLQGLRSQG